MPVRGLPSHRVDHLRVQRRHGSVPHLDTAAYAVAVTLCPLEKGRARRFVLRWTCHGDLFYHPMCPIDSGEHFSFHPLTLLFEGLSCLLPHRWKKNIC